jgi:hypothetical protein
VYSNSVGFTLEFENSKRLVGLSGIFIGIGEISGLFLILGSLLLLFKSQLISIQGALFLEFWAQKPTVSVVIQSSYSGSSLKLSDFSLSFSTFQILRTLATLQIPLLFLAGERITQL